MPHRRNGRIVMFLLCLFSLISTARPASAEVTRIEFTSKQPYGTFRAGDYVIWQGKIRGDLSPQEAIPGIDKAPRNERGRVDYAAKIILMMPEAPRGENGALLVDVPNRGQVWAEAIYNSPRDVRFLPGTLEQGTGFLQDHGFAVAEVFGSLDRVRTCLRSLTPMARHASSREWALRSSAMPRISSRMQLLTGMERPTRSRELSTACSRAAGPRMDDS